jgi:hypothetical protein
MGFAVLSVKSEYFDQRSKYVVYVFFKHTVKKSMCLVFHDHFL